MELLPLSKISKHFTSQPADEHIHIIIQRSVKTKEVYCTATYGRKSANFQWTTRFIDFNPKVDLDIVVDTSQQPFSLYTFSKMKVLFSLKTNSYDHLPCIEIESQKKSGIVMYKASLPITSVNEATCCEFISVIIYGVTSIFNAKREDINQGVEPQSTVQAHASLQCNRKKRTYDDADLYEGAMYCIVSTGVDWVITKVQSGIGDGNDNGDGNPVEVFLCSPPLPINYPSLT
ncbi:unnamed protein product [Rhizophagus irregularis]|nr:unnamed protein product [Rhizophagus irregularis]